MILELNPIETCILSAFILALVALCLSLWISNRSALKRISKLENKICEYEKHILRLESDMSIFLSRND